MNRFVTERRIFLSASTTIITRALPTIPMTTTIEKRHVIAMSGPVSMDSADEALGLVAFSMALQRSGIKRVNAALGEPRRE